MASCVIFGGAGFIGTHMARHFLRSGRFDHVYLVDIRPSPLAGQAGITALEWDVRKSIPADLVPECPEWIFNLAAVHREPGHVAIEYFDTNLKGARNVCNFACEIKCKNIYFTSSISVYGPTTGPTSESSPICPITPYGGSKYPAELIHEGWCLAANDRRLIIVRPGVVYGPGDPGNILRMIRAIKRGYFVFPGSPKVHKSYAYIYGLLESVDFMMAARDQYVVYNYVESPTESLEEIAGYTKRFLNSRAPIISLPTWLLLPVAKFIQMLVGARNPVHPVRVKKAGMSTHIVPQKLIDMGFKFQYTFNESLKHWQKITPSDFM